MISPPTGETVMDSWHNTTQDLDFARRAYTCLTASGYETDNAAVIVAAEFGCSPAIIMAE